MTFVVRSNLGPLTAGKESSGPLQKLEEAKSLHQTEEASASDET